MGRVLTKKALAAPGSRRTIGTMPHLITSAGLCEIDASRIVSRVYQGAAPPPGNQVRRCGFSLLVLCAEEYQPPGELFDGVQVLHVPLDDAELSAAEWQRAAKGARAVCKHVMGKGRALVTCMAGRNRSGLVTAMTLRLLTGAKGDAIVDHIQRRRAHALTNRSFVQALKTRLT